MKRVLKPGGLLASREAIMDSCFIEPAGEHTPEAWAAFTRLLSANSGHPQMGRELKRELLKAGFADITASGSFDYFGTAEEIDFQYTIMSEWFFTPRVMAAVTEYGLTIPGRLEQWRRETGLWKDDPGAVGGIAFGEATGWKPWA